MVVRGTRDAAHLDVARVLIVDGDASRRSALATLAGRAGHQIVEASSGHGAVAFLERESVDVILVDGELAVGSNYASLIALHDYASSGGTPIVLLVDHAEFVDLEAVRAAGGDDLLERPIGASVLSARLYSLSRANAMVRRERAIAETAVHEREAVARLAAQKDSLTEFLVHDLKSPIASVMLALQELLTIEHLPLDRDAVKACLGTAETVGRMVMNLLDVTSGRELKVSAEWCDAGELLSHLRMQFAPRLGLREVALATRVGDRKLWADPDLLRRVAENLLDNAIRYAPPGSQIDLVVESDDEGVGLTVSDRGPGVPEPHRERIFDRFAQLDPDAGRRASRGLGLAFCRVVADAHGGRIWVEEPLGGGARFRMWLPGGADPC